MVSHGFNVVDIVHPQYDMFAPSKMSPKTWVKQVINTEDPIKSKHADLRWSPLNRPTEPQVGFVQPLKSIYPNLGWIHQAVAQNLRAGVTQVLVHVSTYQGSILVPVF